MNWFERLVGFRERDPDQVRANLRVEGEYLSSEVNGETFRCGTLGTPSLAELRELTAPVREAGSGAIAVQEVVADVQHLHRSAECDGALFQVASQFNLLEMVGPGVTPEQGVGIYEHDATQGPACAIACGAGTIFRNYFVEIGGGIRQTEGSQIDCLADLGNALGNSGGSLWKMRNGYALATEEGLRTIGELLRRGGDDARDRLRSKLRIGVQWQAGVTLEKSSNVVTQTFCSALPVAYSSIGSSAWEPFARLVLEGAYEATLHAGLLNRATTGSAQVYLTMLGGGAFGNSPAWIADALERSLDRMRDTGLEVKIVSYGSPTPAIQHLLG